MAKGKNTLGNEPPVKALAPRVVSPDEILETLARLVAKYLGVAGPSLEVTITTLPGTIGNTGGNVTITGWVNTPQPLTLQGWFVPNPDPLPVQNLAVPYGSSSWSWSVQLPNTAGSYTWVVRAYYVDLNGNPHAAEDQVTIIVQ
jgi:hypothetical protein